MIKFRLLKKNFRQEKKKQGLFDGKSTKRFHRYEMVSSHRSQNNNFRGFFTLFDNFFEF